MPITQKNATGRRRAPPGDDNGAPQRRLAPRKSENPNGRPAREDAEQFAAGRVRERLVNTLKTREPRDRKSELPQQWKERPESIFERAGADALREPRLAGPTHGRIESLPRDGADALRRARAAAAAAAFTKTGADEVLRARGSASAVQAC